MDTIKALWIRNIKAFVRDRARLIVSIITPFFFVYVFSSVFTVSGTMDMAQAAVYMTAGVIIITVFQTALTVSTSTIDDITTGFMKEILVSPTKRIHIAIGQILSSATIAVVQGLLILMVGVVIGIRFTSIINFIVVLLVMALVGVVFGAFGLFLATIVKNSQTFQIVQMAIVLPFTFLSGAYIPLYLLPQPLQILSYLNPMTHATNLFRTVILGQAGATPEELLNQGLAISINGYIITPYESLVILVLIGVIFVGLSTYYFTKADFSKINRSGKKARRGHGRM